MMIYQLKTFRYSCRRGFTLMEATAACFLLIVALSSLAQLLGWVAGERRAFERRRLVVAEAANLMERATALPWERIDDESLKKLRFSDDVRSNLPTATLAFEIAEKKEDAIESKKISLTIRWIGPGGVHDRPVRLVAWVHRSRRKS